MKPYRVLSLDGGGMRGLYTATVLQTIASRLSSGAKNSAPDIGKGFDLITGTSTGGILACALAFGISIDRIIDFYRNDGPKIFRRPAPRATNPKIIFWFLGSLFRAGNSSSHLRSVLAHIFGDETLTSMYEKREIAVLIPAVAMRKEQPKIFRTPHNPTKRRESNFSLIDTCLATSAAPVLFPLSTPGSSNDPSENEIFADGGLWANNPTLVGLCEALELSQPDQPIEIISASTGPFPTDIFAKGTKLNLGLAHWGSGLNALSLFSNAQAAGTDYLAHQLCDRITLLGKKVTLVRLPVSTPPEEETKELRLDAVSKKAIAYFQRIGLADGQTAVRSTQNANDPNGLTLRAAFGSLPS